MVIGDNWTRTSIHSQYAIASFSVYNPKLKKKKKKDQQLLIGYVSLYLFFSELRNQQRFFRSTCMKINQDIGRQFVMEKKFSSRSFVTNL